MGSIGRSAFPGTFGQSVGHHLGSRCGLDESRTVSFMEAPVRVTPRPASRLSMLTATTPSWATGPRSGPGAFGACASLRGVPPCPPLGTGTPAHPFLTVPTACRGWRTLRNLAGVLVWRSMLTACAPRPVPFGTSVAQRQRD
jgi:hypothetical protein